MPIFLKGHLQRSQHWCNGTALAQKRYPINIDDGFVFYALSTLFVISRQRKDYDERLCVMRCHTVISRILPQYSALIFLAFEYLSIIFLSNE